MIFSRRGLLSLFGKGAIVAPIAKGVAALDNAVSLIEPAKFEPVAIDPVDPRTLLSMNQMYAAEITLMGMNGVRAHLIGKTFILKINPDQLISPRGGFMDWELSGAAILGVKRDEP